MKKLVFALALIFGFTTNALAEANQSESANVESEVLAALAAHSRDIALKNSDGSKFQYTPPQLIAGALQKNYLSGNSVLSATTVTCKNVTPQGRVDATQYQCKIRFVDGDFMQTEDSLNGPEGESTYFFAIDAIKLISPKAVMQITTDEAIVGIFD